MEDARIEQFRKMAEADPQNELGHFSLGRALLEVGRYAEAKESLKRAVELNPQNSRAYHLLAQAIHGDGDPHSAITTLRAGISVADQRGDMKAREDMAGMLRELGEEPPPVTGRAAAPATATPSGSDTVHCSRCGQAAPRMAKQPFKGPLGEQVYASVCSACWQEWIRMGTKVINELRLNFADPRHSAMYDEHMREFLNLQKA